MPLVFLTAWALVVEKAKVTLGDTVLVHAAGSGVSSAAIQIARALGGRVITTASTAEKAAAARELGAEEVVDRSRQDFVAETKRWTEKKGVDVVIDHIGGELFSQSLTVLASGGRVATCGATGGPPGALDLTRLFMRYNTILGTRMGAKRTLFPILRGMERRTFRPVVHKVLPMTAEGAREAHRMLEAREAFGKVVLKSNGGPFGLDQRKREAVEMSRLETVLEYWFGLPDQPLTVKRFQERGRLWFMRNETTDRHIREQFAADVDSAARGDLTAWADSARGRLALIVLLDQFPRNIHRDSALAFAHDPLTRELALDGARKGLETSLATHERLVFYLPLMHAEDCAIQSFSIDCYRRLREEALPEFEEEMNNVYSIALRHKEIVDRFQRFPHRNQALGRETTEAERAFLMGPNSSF